jgi:hypothetical protein
MTSTVIGLSSCASSENVFPSKIIFYIQKQNCPNFVTEFDLNYLSSVSQLCENYPNSVINGFFF